MIPASWLLEAATPVSVVACGDPAETLARLAGLHGVEALNGVHLARRPPSPLYEVAPHEAIAVHAARAAWRFAAAAIVLANVAAILAEADHADALEPGTPEQT